MLQKTYTSISDIGSEEWGQLVSKRFFLSYDYLLSLEKACPQIEYRYVLSYENSEFKGLCYFQVIPFLGQNLFQYLPSDNKILSYLFKNFLRLIHTNLLVLGNVIFTCENGFLSSTISSSSTTADILNLSIEAARKSITKKPLATMISENITTISPKKICDGKFHEFKVEDRMEIDLSAYSSFQHYKESLQSKYRVRLNKVYQLNSNTEIINIDRFNFESYKEDIKRLFNNVVDNSKFKLISLNENYFNQFVQNLDRFKLKGFLISGKLAGFVSYFQLDTIIEVHYVGLDYNLNHSHKIYNFILYSILESSFSTQHTKICYGRTAQELKSTLGAKPFSISSSLKINHLIINLLTPFFLKRMYPESWILRHPFKN
jgi:hypothetical protein